MKGYSRSPDDDVFIHLAKTYSFNHASMYKGTGCDSKQTFPEGITNGYSWYQLEGKNVGDFFFFSAASDTVFSLSSAIFDDERAMILLRVES